MSSISNNFRYCLIIEFFGSVRIRIREFSSKSSNEAHTGSLPINSGINPNLRRSYGCKSFSISPVLLSSFSLTSAPKPTDLLVPLSEIIF